MKKSFSMNRGDDVIFLPAIVDAAVASPAAATECARLIRKYLDRDYWSKPSYQYNAIMLLRILADNPGPGFTRYLDKKFVDTAKELLRSGRDASVRQLLMETLDSFEVGKGFDEGLKLTIEMWKREKDKAYKAYGIVPAIPRNLNAPPFNPHQTHAQQQYYTRPPHTKRLPEPAELANRLEEARTSAGLLEQVVACTPSSEVLTNDLIKEFADRCTGASHSIQAYMVCENPAPDNDTMESLIDTNEQLQQALNHHHRAVLQAKKKLNHPEDRSTDSSPARANTPSTASHHHPHPTRNLAPAAASSSNGNGKGKANLDIYDSPPLAGPSRSISGTPRRDYDSDDGQDPFRDPPAEPSSSKTPRSANHNDGGAFPYIAFDEPFHPGFGGAASEASSGKVAAAAAERDKVRRASVSSEELEEYRASLKKEGGNIYRY
ncbi:hypothetical protein N0V88_003471 [Collariella sp. IMI 366227]|nr:hypothetical protein N0V88_003471 [Collariella sp. IMI 366227]